MTVLNSYERMTYDGTFIEIVFIFSAVFAVICLIFTIVAVCFGDYGTSAISGVAALILVVFASLIGDRALEKHTEYEVIVEDYNEIFERGFEIVEQRGEIVVIRKADADEKEESDK